jgi:hypothetical protein
MPLQPLDTFISGFFFDSKKFRPISVRSNDQIPPALLRHGLEGQVTKFWTPCISNLSGMLDQRTEQYHLIGLIDFESKQYWRFRNGNILSHCCNISGISPNGHLDVCRPELAIVKQRRVMNVNNEQASMTPTNAILFDSYLWYVD